MKKIAVYFLSALLLFVICILSMHDHLIGLNTNTGKEGIVAEAPSIAELQILRKRLIDTSGRKLTLSNKKYYILNFGYGTSAASQVKLQFLKDFARQAAPQLKVLYIADAKMETFEEFKSKLKADKSDKVIYAYLYDDKLLQTLGINKYPAEILVGPGFRFIRKQVGFYSFDATTYANSTLSLIDR